MATASPDKRQPTATRPRRASDGLRAPTTGRRRAGPTPATPNGTGATARRRGQIFTQNVDRAVLLDSLTANLQEDPEEVEEVEDGLYQATAQSSAPVSYAHQTSVAFHPRLPRDQSAYGQAQVLDMPAQQFESIASDPFLTPETSESLYDGFNDPFRQYYQGR